MRTMLAVLVLMAVAGMAQGACDQTLTMTVTYDGAKVAESKIVYYGLAETDVAAINKKGANIADTAGRHAEKGGQYAVLLGEQHKCEGGAQTQNPELPYEGLTLSGMGQVLRAANKAGIELVKAGEDEGKKGHKKAWGNK